MAELAEAQNADGTAGRLSALIVEDGGEIREGIGRVTNGKDNSCLLSEASSESQSMFRLGLAMPDVVIVDVTMAGHIGMNTLERLREVSTVPVIALADGEGPQAWIQYLSMGADQCVSKDVSPRELLARARALVRRDQRSSRRPALDGYAA